MPSVPPICRKSREYNYYNQYLYDTPGLTPAKLVVDLATPEGCKAEFDGGVETKTVQSVIIIILSAIVGGVAQW